MVLKKKKSKKGGAKIDPDKTAAEDEETKKFLYKLKFFPKDEFEEPPPLPFEKLVNFLSINEVDYCDVYNLRLPAYLCREFTPQEIKDLHDVFVIFAISADEQEASTHGRNVFLKPVEFINCTKILGFNFTEKECELVFNKSKLIWKEYVKKERENTKKPESQKSHRSGHSGSADQSSTVDEQNINEEWSLNDEMKYPGLMFSQFLEAILLKQGHAFDCYQEILFCFDRFFDLHGNGQLSEDNLMEIANSNGLPLTKKEARDMIAFGDKHGAGFLTRREFLQVMVQTNIYRSYVPR